MKADLHNHFLIGFQGFWLERQGYFGKNLARALVNTAAEKGIGLVAITSENFDIPKGSVHDRFGRICDDAEKIVGPYSFSKLGENILIAKSREKKIYIVNGQTVIINENGKRYDHLVVGSNQVPNNRDFDYTFKYLRDNNLLNFFEHLAAESHCGVGVDLAKKLLDKYGEIITGVEGYNGSMIWHERYSRIPLIGEFNRGVNLKSKLISVEFGKPYIATSDARSPEQTGAGNIEFTHNLPFSEDSEKEFFSEIKQDIEQGIYKCNENYVSKSSWIKNAVLFALGTKVFGMGRKS